MNKKTPHIGGSLLLDAIPDVGVTDIKILLFNIITIGYNHKLGQCVRLASTATVALTEPVVGDSDTDSYYYLVVRSTRPTAYRVRG